MLDTIAQGRRAVETAFVVFGPPDPDARSLVNLERSIEHNGRGRVPIIERRGIDEGFERRARLPQCLGRSVELALIKREAAYHGENAPRLGIFDNHGAGYVRDLVENKLSFGFGWLDVDDIAGTDDLADFADCLSAGLCPLHALKRQYSDRAFFADVTAWLAPRLQTDAGRLVAHLHNDRQPPGRHVGQGLHVGKFDTPVAGDVDLGDCAAPALCFVITDQAVGE